MSIAATSRPHFKRKTRISEDSGPALAEFPEKDITLIVPWSAGGGTDTIARQLVADADAENCLGTGVNVVNRTGAVGASGMGATADAHPEVI